MAKTRSTQASKKSGWFTPLGIVATFVTLTETVLGYAVTQVNGGVQIALTAFVIIFAILVAAAFFAILWNRPYNFYSPHEFGDSDPQKYIEAFRQKLPNQFEEKFEVAEANPFDENSQFSLIDSLIDDVTRQFIILMDVNLIEIQVTYHPYGIPYQIGDSAKQTWSSGTVSGSELYKRLGNTGLVEFFKDRPSIRLTDYGRRFSKWLVDKGKKAELVATPKGGWGTLAEFAAKVPPDFLEGMEPFSPVNRARSRPDGRVDETANGPEPSEKAST